MFCRFTTFDIFPFFFLKKSVKSQLFYFYFTSLLSLAHFNNNTSVLIIKDFVFILLYTFHCNLPIPFNKVVILNQGMKNMCSLKVHTQCHNFIFIKWKRKNTPHCFGY